MLMSHSRIANGEARRTRAWLRIACAGAALALLAACDKKPAPAPRAAIEVTVMTVTQRDTPVEFEFTAQTQSSREVEIRARVDGFLDKRMYTEGALVQAGQTLFLMDTQAVRSGAADRRRASSRSSRRGSRSRRPISRAWCRSLAQNALSKKDLDDAIGSEKQAEAAVIAARGRGADRRAQPELHDDQVAAHGPVELRAGSRKAAT